MILLLREDEMVRASKPPHAILAVTACYTHMTMQADAVLLVHDNGDATVVKNRLKDPFVSTRLPAKQWHAMVLEHQRPNDLLRWSLDTLSKCKSDLTGLGKCDILGQRCEKGG